VRLSKIVIAMILLSISILGIIPTMGSEETEIIEVEVLIDLGNGVVNWAQVTLDTNHNALNATQKAGDQLNIDIVVIWGIYGGFISEIEGLSSSDFSWWWGFFIWNDTESAWETSSVGASSLELNDGDIIGWAPVWDYMNPTMSMATPTAKYPWPSFQANGYHTGISGNSGPETNSIEWIFDTETKELAASPVLDKDGVIVNNWGGTFYLDHEGDIIWKNTQVQGVFTPTIGNDKVLVGGKDGFLYALNLTDGKVLWKTKITDNPGASGVTSSPTIVMGKVYLGSYDSKGGAGFLFCLDERTGNIVWKNTTYSSVYFSSPSVYGDRVYVGTMGLYNSSNMKWEAPYGIYCFNTKTGEALWSYPVEGSVGSSPTIVDEKVLFTSKNGYIYSLDAEMGTMIWKKEIGSSVSSPAVKGDSIYVGSGEMNGDGKFYSLDMNGNINWEFVPNGAVQSSPAVAGYYVYFASNVEEGTVYCLNNTNGDLVWEYRPWPNEYIISSPAIVDGRVYIASDNGRLYCFEGESANIIVAEEGITKIIHLGEDAKVAHGDEEFGLNVRSIYADKVTVEIDTVSKTLDVQVGGSKKVDTNGDGEKDLLITVNSADPSSQSASITLEKFSESQDLFIYYLIVIMVIVVIIVIFLLIRRGSKKIV
jgi:hypothetical protein